MTNLINKRTLSILFLLVTLISYTRTEEVYLVSDEEYANNIKYKYITITTTIIIY
jgi:hypothetical protein